MGEGRKRCPCEDTFNSAGVERTLTVDFQPGLYLTFQKASSEALELMLKGQSSMEGSWALGGQTCESEVHGRP